MKKILFIVTAGFIAVSCMESPIDRTAQTITEESLMEPIEVLSSDEFQGRSTGTVGEEKTVEYLIGKFKEYDIEGGASDGGYVQDVPLLGQKTDEDAQIRITKNGNTIDSFDYYSNFMAWPSNLEEDS